MYVSSATNAAQLMKLAQGGFSSAIIEGGQIVGHAGFIPVNLAAFTPLIIFQLLSMITGQHYLNGINKQLKEISKAITLLINFELDNRESKIKIAFEQIKEFGNRQYYVLEDLIFINYLRHEISVIRNEFLFKCLNSLNQIIGYDSKEIVEKKYELDIREINILEKFKLNFNSIGENISNNLEQLFSEISNLKVIKNVSQLTEKSNKVMWIFKENFDKSNFFYFAQMALDAEFLYQHLKILELKMNIMFRNPDENRIGKIRETLNNLDKFDDDSIYPEFKKMNQRIQESLNQIYRSSIENSIVNKNEIHNYFMNVKDKIDNLEIKLKLKNEINMEVNFLNELLNKQSVFMISKNEDKIQVYMKNL